MEVSQDVGCHFLRRLHSTSGWRAVCQAVVQTLSQAMLATGSVPGSAARLGPCRCCSQHKQSDSDKAAAEGPPPHPSIPPDGEQQSFPHLYRTEQSISWRLLPSQCLQKKKKKIPNKTNKRTGPVPAVFPFNNIHPDPRTNHSQFPGHFSTAREPSTYPELSLTPVETEASRVQNLDKTWECL